MGTAEIDILWKDNSGKITLESSPLDCGVKFIHKGNGSIVWISEDEAADIVAALLRYLES